MTIRLFYKALYNVTISPGGGGGGYSRCKGIRGCAALIGRFFEKNPGKSLNIPPTFVILLLILDIFAHFVHFFE